MLELRYSIASALLHVPLEPCVGTMTYGRSGFFLHGGSYAGSAGCIDVGGGWFGCRHTDLLLQLIVRETSPVRVQVRA
jgi:hypothetical protein